MERNEMMLGIMLLFDELTKLKEENARLREALAAEGGEEPKGDSALVRALKDIYFYEKIQYNLDKTCVRYKDESGTTKTKVYKVWKNELTIDNVLGYNHVLLEVASMQEVKDFFDEQLRREYELLSAGGKK